MNYEDKLIYDGWLKLYERKLNGKKYCIIDNYDAVGCIIVNNKDEILLVKQFRPALLKDTLEIPAGCLDIKGEAPIKTAIRELEEESGIIVCESELKKVAKYNSNVGFAKSKMTLYMAKLDKVLYSKEIYEDEDVRGIVWMPLKTFEEKINSEEITDNKTIMTYFILKNMDML